MTRESAEDERRKAQEAAEKVEAERLARVRKWAPYRLAVSICKHPGQLTDLKRSAEKSADIMGVPVRIFMEFDGKMDIVEPHRRHLEAYGAYHRVPDFVRKEMGWE